MRIQNSEKKMKGINNYKYIKKKKIEYRLV